MLLLIDNNKKTARNLADMFLYMGFLAYCAAEDEVASELDEPYRAIIFSTPTSISSLERLIKDIRDRRPNVPIFAIMGKAADERAQLFDSVIERGCFASEIAERLIEYADEHSLSIPGHYEYCGIDASADLGTPIYNGTPLPFTKTECMILRYLIISAPNAASAKRILLRAYRPSRMPDVSNIRTHVSIINKKFRSMNGRNLITQVSGVGYKIELQDAVAKFAVAAQ